MATLMPCRGNIWRGLYPGQCSKGSRKEVECPEVVALAGRSIEDLSLLQEMFFRSGCQPRPDVRDGMSIRSKELLRLVLS